jgi:hypothetical protein
MNGRRLVLKNARKGEVSDWSGTDVKNGDLATPVFVRMIEAWSFVDHKRIRVSTHYLSL